MSSNLNMSVRTSDLALLQGVLDDAGYDCTSSLAEPKYYNVAVRLLFKLYHDGMTSPAALSIELSRHFGKHHFPRNHPRSSKKIASGCRVSVQPLKLGRLPAPEQTRVELLLAKLIRRSPYQRDGGFYAEAVRTARLLLIALGASVGDAGSH